MEPQVRYARTSDGVSIAYSVAGGGPATPSVWLPGPPFGHSQLSWGLAPWRARFEGLAVDRPFVFVDFRGMGMSDRKVDDLSLEALVSDLSAVVDHLELERFDLHATGHSGFVGIAYAERNPQRIAHLVLRSAYPNVRSAGGDKPRLRALQRLLESDWDMYTTACAQQIYGWAPDARDIAAVFRESTTQEFALALGHSMSRIDVTDLLPRVHAPTLVLHRDNPFSSIEASRFLASRISGARVVVFEGAFETVDDAPEELRILREFLGNGPTAALPQRVEEDHGATRIVSPRVHGTTTVLFTDLVGHTAMMQRLGDARGRDVLREHERITRETLAGHGGHEIKTDGDSFMVSFGSVTSAVDCAIALQRAFAARNEGADEALHVRIGLNAGEPVEEDGDLFGATVILASRIAAKAGAGEILVPDTVRGLLSGKGFVFGDRGEFLPQGFDEGVRVWDVRWREGSND